MLKDLLIKKKSSIINNWVRLIIETYPSKTSGFLKSQKDRFSNPVGYTISDSADKIFEEIINQNDIEKVKTSLTDLIKIRAVQNFSPSKATGFIFSLKSVIRKELEQEVIEGKVLSELNELESFIDDTALTAFDVYMDAKEKLFKIRINEIKAQLAYSKGITE